MFSRRAPRLPVIALVLFSQGGWAFAEPLVRRSLPVPVAGTRLKAVLANAVTPPAIPRALPVVPRAVPVVHAPRPPLPTRLAIGAPLAGALWEPRTMVDRRSVARLLADCQALARAGFPYVFGGESPAEGGFDCSGVIHYLLGLQGRTDIPRVAYDQYRWLEAEGELRRVRSWTRPERVLAELRPGDLLFWEGTYQTGRSPNVSHVMIYVGIDRASGKHLMFGARSGKTRGRNGNAVDVFEFRHPKPGGRGRLIGFGSLPAARR